MALDIALAKAQIRVTHDAENSLIQQYMDAAAAAVEQASGTLLTRRAVTQRFALFGRRLPLFWGPDPDEVTITYVDIDEVDREIVGARIVRDWLHAPEAGWPSIATDTVIEITYTAGWAEVPADLINAQLILIQAAYERHAPSKDEQRAIDDLIQPHRRILV